MRLFAALLLAASPAAALTPEDIRSAAFDGEALSEGQSGLAFATQVLLDRAGVSPGVIDGYDGGMTETALRAFERREGFEVDGQLDLEVWEALGGPSMEPAVQDYTITEEDVSGIASDGLPDDYAELAERDAIPHTSVAERLAERFHMDEDVLRALNDGTSFEAGQTITVAAPGDRTEGEVTRIAVRKADGRVDAMDADGAILASYPAAIGSQQTPSPSGTVEVVAVAMDPTYSYRPDVNFQQGDNAEPLTLPPGPNGPVGAVWIDLSKETYGIHGTPEPASLFQEASHGCVRLTNWDAEELAFMVSQGVTVEFVE
ncbi:murein L,D-transpeptidase [Jannaschia sp. Os4]|uniref:L,D-transpeptidase family protein n=1 Tax=Jannaschia sp. Os4 TaxID=2807617 RepID=UPI001939B52E|nr:L,D-transpeptidase [Jannaschia sp. Os4]MBM2576555.1 murein L,D-transpeptidase [Jannaschia sp. Os4]